MAEIEKSATTRRIKLGSILTVLFLLLYIPSLIFWIYGKNVTTDIVRMGEIEDSINVDAVIVRNEVVMNSALGGKCIKEISEGEKVKANERIATVLNGSSEKLLEELKRLDLRIIDAQKKRNENLELFSDDLEKIDKEIEEKFKRVIAISNFNALSEIKEIKKEVDGLIEKKAVIAGSLSSPDTHIKGLLSEKEMLQQRISSNTKDIRTTSSGVVSYVVDGYEEVLTPDKISDYTLQDIESIEARGIQKDIEELGVEANKPFAKIITGIEYYLVLSVDTTKANEFKVDAIIEIRLNEFDKIIKGDVFYRSDDLGGKSILAVRVSNALSETAALRTVNIDLIKSKYGGFKVPLKSLINIDYSKNSAELGLVKANRARFIKVKIIGKNEEFAIIENGDIKPEDYSVNLYSSYIVNPVNIEEGQTIN